MRETDEHEDLGNVRWCLLAFNFPRINMFCNTYCKHKTTFDLRSRGEGRFFGHKELGRDVTFMKTWKHNIRQKDDDVGGDHENNQYS